MDKAGLTLTPQAVDWGSDGQISICTAASDTGAVIFKGDGEIYLIGKQKHIWLPLLSLPSPDGWSLGSFLEGYTEICVN